MQGMGVTGVWLLYAVGLCTLLHRELGARWCGPFRAAVSSFTSSAHRPDAIRKLVDMSLMSAISLLIRPSRHRLVSDDPRRAAHRWWDPGRIPA
eukprot:188413-Prymnesium_polylepis.2